jgi:hypothetical protein
MRLPELTSIDLAAFERACSAFIELSYLDLPEGGTVFDPQFADALEDAVLNFDVWVADRFDEEAAIRVALAYLLNLDEERFRRAVGGLRIHFQGDWASLRRLFERLWDQTFAPWRIPDFDPDAYMVTTPRR